MANHTVRITVTVYMEDMDGHPELSAEIADAQVEAALNGRESTYGYPGDFTVQVEDYWITSTRNTHQTNNPLRT